MLGLWPTKCVAVCLSRKINLIYHHTACALVKFRFEHGLCFQILSEIYLVIRLANKLT